MEVDTYYWEVLQEHCVEQNKKVNALAHPAYSPNLSPCDFFFFSHDSKKIILDRDIIAGVHLEVQRTSVRYKIPRTDYYGFFKPRILRLEKCISIMGEYFEGLQ